MGSRTSNPDEFHLRSDRNQLLIDDSDANLNLADASAMMNKIDYDIPNCARDVFLTLHKDDDQGEEQKSRSTCKGMLLRDDIILTSRKCSKLTFTFEFPDAKANSSLTVRAIPHASLNLHDDELDPRLGFLLANTPYHYHFVDQPVRRMRMFLSTQASLDIDDDAAMIMTCDNHKPVAHKFPAGDNGELVPLAHLKRVLLDDIFWKETDTNTALIMLKDENSPRWWTRPTTRKEEEKMLTKLLATFEGPPGSVSIPEAHVTFLSQIGGLGEAVDPRGHRRQNCFKNYFFRWQHASPFSGLHFFDWLDFGDGKDLFEKNDTDTMLGYHPDDLECFKKDFNAKKIHYFDDEERAAHAVNIKPSSSGKEIIVRYKQSDQLVPRSIAKSEKEKLTNGHLYMLDLDGTFYIVDDTWDEEKYGEIKHTAVLAGRPALSAGKIFFGKNGHLTGINYSSGHYRPGIPALSMTYQLIKEKGLNVTAMQWSGRTTWTTEDCKTYDWDSVKIPGFDTISLNQSCHEVITGPTWVRKEDD